MYSRRITHLICVTAFLSSASAVAGGGDTGASVQSDSDWTVLGRTPDNQHFSPLADVNEGNVSRLGLAWYADIPTRDGVVGEPLVSDGIIYQSGTPSVIWAHDLRSGKLLWTFDTRTRYSGNYIPNWGTRINRGLGLWKDKLFVSTGDCKLVAVNRASGKLAWQADVCAGDPKMTMTGAPRVGGGKVFVGPANGDDGSRRGFVDAYDADSGKRLWRFYTIPGDPSHGFEYPQLRSAAKTWGKDYWKRAGSGSVWDGIQYDEKLNLLYLGVSSAMPEAPVDRGAGRGDELFSASIVAINANTGKYVWHYKQTPNNAWNFDATATFTIADLPVQGKQRRVLIQAPKNGFVYLLDAATGELLSADKYGIRMNWASHVDAKTGRPVELPDARYYAAPNHVAVHYPGLAGARTWVQTAYSPLTQLSYIPALDMGSRTTWKPGEPETASDQGPNRPNITSGATHTMLEDNDLLADAKTHLVAWDPMRREVKWDVTEPLPGFGGVLATAGNLVFAPRGTLLRAFSADTGKVLWSQPIPGGMLAPQITVRVDGEQLVLFTIGNNGSSGYAMGLPSAGSTAAIRNAPARLLAFKIDGKAALPITDLSDIYPRPPLPRFPPDVVERGRQALMVNACDYCHGGEHLNPTGSIKNLKKMSAETHAAFEAIVIGGERRALGMPDYSYLDPATLKDIQAFIINEAWNSYEASQQQK